MPLSKTGRRVKAEFVKEYGARKGEQIFYAKENKDKNFAKRVKK